MKKVKILAIFILIIVLSVAISVKVFGKDNRKIFDVSVAKNLESVNISDLTGSKNLYCIEKGQVMMLSEHKKYTIKTRVEINGNKATFYEGNNKNGTTIEHEANNVLAAILNGFGNNYTYGFGVLNDNNIGVKKYYDAQLGLYAYLDTWIATVRSTSGNKVFGFEVTAEKNPDEDMRKIENDAKAAAKKNDYKVEIYLLKTGTANWQNLIAAYPDGIVEKLIDIEVEKKWYDKNDNYGKRPSEIKVGVFDNNTQIGDSLVLNNNKLKGVFKDLPKYREDNKTEIQYKIKEINVPQGYESNVKIERVSDNKWTAIITNTLGTEIKVKRVGR